MRWMSQAAWRRHRAIKTVRRSGGVGICPGLDWWTVRYSNHIGPGCAPICADLNSENISGHVIDRKFKRTGVRKHPTGEPWLGYNGIALDDRSIAATQPKSPAVETDGLNVPICWRGNGQP